MPESGTYAFTSDKALDARRAFAKHALQQGTDTSPVQHWAQAPARVIQALVGGTLLGNAEGQERASEAQTAATLSNMPDLGGAPSATPSFGQSGGGSVPLQRVAAPGGASFAVNSSGADRFAALTKDLEEAGYVIDPSQSSGYARRNIAGTNKPSQHAFGNAIDINWRDNPRGRPSGTLPPNVREIAARHGIRWGGDWKNPDPMHFELIPGWKPAAGLGGPGLAGQGTEPLVPGVEGPGTTQAPMQPSGTTGSLPGGPQVAQATPASGTPGNAPAAQSGAGIDPAMASYIKQLIANPRTRQYGMQLYNNELARSRKDTTPTNDMKEFEAANTQRKAAGLDPYKSIDEYQMALKSAGSTKINIDQKGEAEFNKEAGKLTAKRFNTLIEEGQDARVMNSEMQTLADIASRIKTDGKTAEITAALGPYAEMLGIKVDGLGDLQAYKSLISKLAPRMRAPGSGATSDFDARQFLESLPGLGATPEGKQIIQNTFAALNESKIQAAEIASMAMEGEITKREADKRLRALPDPYEAFRKSRGHAPSETGATSSTTKPVEGTPAQPGAVRRFNPATGRLE